MKRQNKIIARALITWILFTVSINLFYPIYTFALTGGPSQQENNGFESLGNADMVNLVTGDFTHSIPLFELPGSEGAGFKLQMQLFG